MISPWVLYVGILLASIIIYITVGSIEGSLPTDANGWAFFLIEAFGFSIVPALICCIWNSRMLKRGEVGDGPVMSAVVIMLILGSGMIYGATH